MATSVTQFSLLNAANSPNPVAANHPNLSSYNHIIVMFSGGKASLACLLHVHTLLKSINQTHKLELWHHLVDGNEGSSLMDWACTSAYCEAIAKEFRIPLYYSWLQGGFEGEMTRVNEAKQPTWFQSPEGLHCAGGNSPKLGTRLKFPQVSADLRVRWCSSSLKIDVGAIALNNQARFTGKRTLVLSGERAEESPGRARYAAFEPHRCHAKKRHVDHWRPVHGWTNRQV